MTIEFDDRQIKALARDLDYSEADVRKDLRAVVSKGALNIKRDAAKRARSQSHFRRLAASIDYEIRDELTGPSADVGPNHAKPQGNLGHILEYGELRTAPKPYMAPAARAEEPRFAKAVEDIVAKHLEGR